MSAETAHDLIDLTYGPVVGLLSKALRAQFVAAPGKKLIGADFSQIESRINAWMAGEERVLQAFRDYDAGIGPDSYKVAFGSAFGIDPKDVTKPQRQIGKTIILSTGYGGALGAWLRFDPYPDKVAVAIKEQFGHTDRWLKASEQYDKATSHFDLTPDQWIAIKVIINGWRDANPNIVQSWWDGADAAIEAVDAPGTVVSILNGKIQYLCDDGFLWCRLPSGKLLAYARPRLVEKREDYLIDAEGEVVSTDEFSADEIAARIASGAVIKQGRVRTQVQFDGKHPKTGAWGSLRLYGGMQCNNWTQATARELLRFAMHNVEDAGYPIVLTVHDEIVSELDEDRGSVAEYQAVMSRLPPWLQGLPLACKAWTDLKYVK